MMWEKSEKHLALGLLFAIGAQPLTGFVGFLILTFSIVHLGCSLYHSFKE